VRQVEQWFVSERRFLCPTPRVYQRSRAGISVGPEPRLQLPPKCVKVSNLHRLPRGNGGDEIEGDVSPWLA
jgi:hypothetical protein